MKSGSVKLGDFGVAVNFNDRLADKKVVGSPYWMAPEVIELQGGKFSSDIWSLGCTVIELLDGRPPYAELPAMAALYQIVENECPPFPEHASAELKDFLKECFERDPDARISAENLMKHEWFKDCMGKGVNSHARVENGEEAMISMDIIAEQIGNADLISEETIKFSEIQRLRDLKSQDSDWHESLNLDEIKRSIVLDELDFLLLKSYEEIPVDVLELTLSDISRILENHPDLTEELFMSDHMFHIMNLLKSSATQKILDACLEILIHVSKNSTLFETICDMGYVSVLLELANKYPQNLNINHLLNRIISFGDRARSNFFGAGGAIFLKNLLNNGTIIEQKSFVVEAVWFAFSDSYSWRTRTFYAQFLGQTNSLSNLIDIFTSIDADLREKNCIADKLCEILIFLSRSNSPVRENLCNVQIIKQLASLFQIFSVSQKKRILIAIRNLVDQANFVDSLEQSDCFEIFINPILLGPETNPGSELSIIMVKILYSYCRMSASRLVKVCSNSQIIGILKNFTLSKNHELKEYSLSILIDLSRASNSSRISLWENGIFQIFIHQLDSSINMKRKVLFLESIICWLMEDPGRIENALMEAPNYGALIRLFTNSDQNLMPNILPIYQKLLLITSELSNYLAQDQVIEKIVESFPHQTVRARIFLLKILMSLLPKYLEHASKETQDQLKELVYNIMDDESPIIVREIASKIMERMDYA